MDVALPFFYMVRLAERVFRTGVEGQMVLTNGWNTHGHSGQEREDEKKKTK